MKTLRRVVAVLVALVVIAAGVVWLNLNHIVKSAVETEGTRSLRLETTLSSAHVSLAGGKVGLHGLAIASPHGFAAPQMLRAGDIDVAVRYGELRNHPIHVESLTIDEPTLVIEQANGALNFRKAMELIPASDPNKPPMKLVIDRLAVRGAKVVIRPGLPGLQKEIITEVPALEMKDVGRGAGAHNGAAIKQVAMKVIDALAEKAARSSDLPPEVKALLHLNAAQVASALGSEAIKDLGVQVPGQLGNELKGLLPQGRSPKAGK